MVFKYMAWACPNWAWDLNTWFCTAWPASCRALFAALVKIWTKGGAFG